MKTFYIILMLGLSLIGCAPTPQPEKPKEEEEKPKWRYIGQITSVHEDEGFVLIRNVPNISVDAGTILISQGINGNTANLRASGESLGQMIAADIQSGIAQTGDSVRESLIEESEVEAYTEAKPETVLEADSGSESP